MSLKEKLAEVKDKEQHSDLYQHLSNVLTKILLDNPKNAFELFEDYSLQVRQSGYTFGKHQEFDNASRLGFQLDGDNAEKTNKLLGKLMVGGPDDPQEAGPTGYVPNMMEEAKWFEWAGVGFGQDETYKIFKALTVLSVTKQAKQVRLWGKVAGTYRDYYVAEGQADTAADDGDLAYNVEARGTGVNKLNYWVTTDLLNGEWVELPLIYPQHITVSRRIKHIFTGDLEAPVITNPYFFGKEKHLLKAQIVRISQSTTIVPKGMYTISEDDPKEINPTEEYKMPSFHQLKSLDSWVHLNNNILKAGRLTHILPPDLPEDKDPEKEMKHLETVDPYEPRLKPITLDRHNGRPAWKLRVQGDSSDYDPLAKDASQKVNYGFIVIKSLVWPGLTFVYHNKQWQSLYVGYGFKQVETHFFPKEPQTIQIEFTDKDEFVEPNFPPEQPDQPQA